MNKRYHDEDSGITLLEAIETLSSIAELQIDEEISVAETGEVMIGERRVVDWLNLQNEEETVAIIKDIFALILKYIQGVYDEHESDREENVIEGIKTIMVFVGEAAKKLDRFTELFHWAHRHPITELVEYQKLQNFYQDRIAKQVDTRQLSRWILGLAQQPVTARQAELKAKKKKEHVFVDLEAVKKDSEYELFYLRKEDGSRFFSPQLVRNITLVCDFGGNLAIRPEERRPVIAVRNWQDWRMRGTAECVRDYVLPQLGRFYRETNRYKSRELIQHLQQALMALMLSCNIDNDLGEDFNRKSTFDYFADFVYFLRAALCCRDYQKLIAYPPSTQNRLAYAQLDLLHNLCYALFMQARGQQHLIYALENTLDRAESILPDEHQEERINTDEVSSTLTHEYKAIKVLMKHHPDGPLIKILNSIQEGDYQFFDPIWQHALPCQLYSLYMHEQRLINIGMPCPVHQESIHRAILTEEFKAFVRSLKESPVTHRHLIINMQDRTSWREHARCKALESVQNIKDFGDHLTVVTLNKDTDFYHQRDPYADENHAAVFIDTFVDQLRDEKCGFYFPEWIKEELKTEMLHRMMDSVHRIFFNEKNVLSREQRQDFIEVFFCFLELKLIDLVRPESFTLMCKDGVDISTCSNALLYVLIKLCNQEELRESDYQYLRMILYAPSLSLRERVPIPDRFDRMISAMRVIESLKDEFGSVNFGRIVHEAFGKFYQAPILDSLVVPAHD